MEKATDQEKFINELKKKLSVEARISNTCSYPYWNDKGSFVELHEYINDAPYQGYNPGGPSQITNNTKKYLGKTLSKICTIARKFNGEVYKDHNNFFVMWSK